MDLVVEGKSERIPPGSHICQLYNKPGEIIGVTARLLQQGLKNGEKCFYAGTVAAIAELKEALTKSGIEVTVVQEKNQLIFQEERDPLLVDKRFDPYHLLSTHQTLIAQARRDNWQAVRISIDMTWLTQDIASPEQILKYEAAADAVFTFQNAPIVALMHYDYSKLASTLVVEMLKLHPIAIVGKFIKRNPTYVNSEQYLLKILRVNKDRRILNAV